MSISRFACLLLLLAACSRAHPPGMEACPEPVPETNAPCEGQWACESAIDGSTARHHEEHRCEAGRVVSRFWSVPYTSPGWEPDELDASVDAGDRDASLRADDETCAALCANACQPFPGDRCHPRCAEATRTCSEGERTSIRECARDWCDGLPPCLASVACFDVM